jgi:hypothetical protein
MAGNMQDGGSNIMNGLLTEDGNNLTTEDGLSLMSEGEGGMTSDVFNAPFFVRRRREEEKKCKQ